MAEEKQGSPPTRILVACAALVIVIAGIRAASAIVTPVLVALFLAASLASPVVWLEQRRVPRTIAVLLVVLATVGIITGLGAVIGASVGGFLNAIPVYQARLDQQFTHLFSWLQGYGLTISRDTIQAGMDPGRAM